MASAQRWLVPQQGRAAQGKQFLGIKPGHVQPDIAAVPVTDGDIHILAGEVDMVQGRADPQVDGGMGFGKSAKPVNKPFRGEIGRGADRQHAGVLALQQPVGSGRDTVQRRRGSR